MGTVWSRRDVLGVLAAGSAGLAGGEFLSGRSASAQAGNGLLEQVRKRGVIKIGITSGLPFSALNPDGSVDGVAPTIVRTVMERLGVPKVEAVVISYGELIPGLQAGRWDMIGADMTITKARCEQVVYADPFTVDYAAYPYLPSELPNPPKSIKEIGAQNLKFGVLAGTYNMALFKAAYKSPENILVFPDTPSIMEALYGKRIQIGCTGGRAAKQMLANRPGAFAYLYPLPDDVLSAASAAFRPADIDLITSFQTEFRKMKQSGEWEKIITHFTFDVFPGSKELTSEQACKTAPA